MRPKAIGTDKPTPVPMSSMKNMTRFHAPVVGWSGAAE
jgi:hypothetical protein